MTFYSTEFQKPVVISRKNNIRRLSLKVCRITGEISINAPKFLSESEIYKFYYLNRNWIHIQINQCLVPKIVKEGLFLPVEGNLYEIVVKKSCSKIKILENNQICIPKNISDIGKELQTFLLEYCKSVMIPIILKKSNLIQKKIKKISFKDTKSRWGSCSSTGSIMLNWRLIMAPPSVYNYVIIHEIAHLVHMNHGPLFWKLVQELSPNYSKDKEWLKKNGREIRRYIF
tara:strand:- start:46 stop:732 length:687 start_codon:yes stop_codon:yes gene_type:complete